MMRVRADGKGLRLRIDQTSEFPRYIIGDEARLRQILINLMGNAIKFTQQGNVTLRLKTKHDETSLLLIEVEDTGIGISPEEHQHIFDPFVQLNERNGSKGTGLGLTITRQFVRMMGGSISLHSAPAKGSLFRVELPLSEAKESDIAPIIPGQVCHVTGLAPDQPEYRILIVEDQNENQLLLARLMEYVGFQIKLAEDGAQAVELFKSWQPHFIWMDRRMPVMDGMEATRRIRELPNGKQVKIVAVTASAYAEQCKEMLAAGMDDYVCKPYRSEEVYACLAKHLGVKYLYEGTTESQVQ
jgi:CheY-like chemotaxis protein